MYLIYFQNNQTQQINVLAFTATLEKAKSKMIELSKEFIIENEGKKKIESVFQEDGTDVSKLTDGYYFIKKDNSIETYKKESKIIIQSGWLSNYQNLSHTLEKVGSYKFAEFDNSMLNQFIDVGYVNKTVITQETKIVKTASMDSVLTQLVKCGFKNHLKPVSVDKKQIIKKNIETPILLVDGEQKPKDN